MTIYETLENLKRRVSALEKSEQSNIKIEAVNSDIPDILEIEKPKRFIKPSLEEVKHYFEQIGVTQLDLGQKFIDFYESKGWKIGKTPMKDWKAACRTWKNNGFSNGSDKKAVKY